jgi:hypothetical protein
LHELDPLWQLLRHQNKSVKYQPSPKLNPTKKTLEVAIKDKFFTFLCFIFLQLFGNDEYLKVTMYGASHATLSVNETEVTNLSQAATSLPNVNTLGVGLRYDAETSALAINVDDAIINAGNIQTLAIFSQKSMQVLNKNDEVFINNKNNDNKGNEKND